MSENEIESNGATYYCDQCGLEYGGPGTCTGKAESGHAPVQVVPIPEGGRTSEPAA